MAPPQNLWVKRGAVGGSRVRFSGMAGQMNRLSCPPKNRHSLFAAIHLPCHASENARQNGQPALISPTDSAEEPKFQIVAEKNTVAPILRTMAERYCIPLTSGRGYCSLPPRHAMAERFRKSGKERLVLLLVSDFDPDGEQIAESFASSMRRDFGIANVDAVKVTLPAG